MSSAKPGIADMRRSHDTTIKSKAKADSIVGVYYSSMFAFLRLKALKNKGRATE